MEDWSAGLCDWRIFSSLYSVKPYQWSRNLNAVHIENIGEILLQNNCFHPRQSIKMIYFLRKVRICLKTSTRRRSL